MVIEKNRVVYLLPKTSLREGEKRRCDLVCGAPVDDWENASLC